MHFTIYYVYKYENEKKKKKQRNITLKHKTYQNNVFFLSFNNTLIS